MQLRELLMCRGPTDSLRGGLQHHHPGQQLPAGADHPRHLSQQRPDLLCRCLQQHWQNCRGIRKQGSSRILKSFHVKGWPEFSAFFEMPSVSFAFTCEQGLPFKGHLLLNVILCEQSMGWFLAFKS